MRHVSAYFPHLAYATVDMALDSEGYHAEHGRERSDDTVTGDEREPGPSSQPFPSPPVTGM